ncbi:hypothetical protein OsJ_13903 [Oryza sativa Japonica Group]|uniref:Uncharacterized protein n=1 Tax=Oryza sativa subsp. japonica TaxID=39947 RepID=A3ARA5_ORYSJ|nr:hypothetical protein OsJ_13903 [Oryza sativa Japonica Group]
MTAPPLVVHEEDEVAGELHEEDGSGGGAQEEEVQVRLRLSSMPATVEHPSLPRGTKFVIIEHPSLPEEGRGRVAPAHSGADEERKGRESCRLLLAAGAAWATPLDRSGRFAGAVAA